jgi:tetratricopeptide (TPR) repeat protein
VLWSLVAAALAAGAWAVINLGGTDPQPATRTAARPPAPAKAVVAARPRPAVTNPLPDTLPAPAPGVPLSARQLEEHLDLMMNSAASGAWAEVEAVARRIATAAGAPPSEPSALVRAGQQAIESTDYETAAATLRNATEQTPDDWRAWSALGYASLRLDRLQEAKTALIRSLRLNPQDASAWAHLGEIFALQEQKRAAAKSLRLAVYYSTQRARTLAHLRQSEATSIQPQFKAVIKEEGAKLDRIPERAPS